MKNYIGLYFTYREVNMLVAYSNKRKRIRRYLSDTLHPDVSIRECFSIQEIEKEDMRYFQDTVDPEGLMELLDLENFTVTRIESEIILNDYEVFIQGFESKFDHIVMPFIATLSDTGISHWESIMDEVRNMRKDEFQNRLYLGFIMTHDLLHNDGTLQAFQSRLEMIESFRSIRSLDDECSIYSDLHYT